MNKQDKKQFRENTYNQIRRDCMHGHYVDRLKALALIVDADREYQALTQLELINHSYRCLMTGSFELYSGISGILEIVTKRYAGFTKKQMQGLHYAFLSPETTPLDSDVTNEARSNG